ESSLLHVRLREVFREQVKTRIQASRSRRRRENIRIDQARIRVEGAVETDAGDLNAVLRVRSTEHDRRCATEEDAVTATHDGLVVEGVAEPEARREVVAVANGRRRVESRR